MSSHDDEKKLKKERKKEKKREKKRREREHDSFSVGSEQSPGKGGKISIITFVAAACGLALIVAFFQPFVAIERLPFLAQIEDITSVRHDLEVAEAQIANDAANSESLAAENERRREYLRENTEKLRNTLLGEAGDDAVGAAAGRLGDFGIGGDLAEDAAALGENTTYDEWFTLVFRLLSVELNDEHLGSMALDDKRDMLVTLFRLTESPSGLKTFKACNLYRRHRSLFRVGDDVDATVGAVNWLVILLPVSGILQLAFAFMARFGRLNAGFLILTFLLGLPFFAGSTLVVGACNADKLPGLLDRAASAPAFGDHDDDGDGGGPLESEPIGMLGDEPTSDDDDGSARERVAGAVADRVGEMDLPQVTVGNGSWLMLCGAGLLVLIALVEPIIVLFVSFGLRNLLRLIVCYAAYAGLVGIAVALALSTLAAVLETIGLSAPMLENLTRAAG